MHSPDFQPRITAATPCLVCGVKKGRHRLRHPFKPRFPNMTNDGIPIDTETSQIARGPLMLDVTLARKLGWSEKTIRHIWNQMIKLAPRKKQQPRKPRP